MSTNILAASSHIKKNTIQPNFKGWTKGAINLYYALMSCASIDNVNDDYYYIPKKNALKMLPGREWKGWGNLGKKINISTATLTRSRALLTDASKEQYCWNGFPVVKEDESYIYMIFNIKEKIMQIG